MIRATWFRRFSYAAVTAMMAGFGLTGIASAQTITNTGQNSRNNITTIVTNNCRAITTHNISAYSNNHQLAQSGNATSNGNTVSGMSWGGWAAMNPSLTGANGTSYSSWWSDVVNWIGQHAGGAGWNGAQNNLTWMPSGNSWGSYDPMAWQANGQSFGNWYNAVESYLNTNSSNWLLTWPSNATGTGGLGSVVTGKATNNYNANFSININNTARTAAGTDSCGHSNFTPPSTGGGMGGGSGSGGSWSAPSSSHIHSPVAHVSGGMGGGNSYGYGSGASSASYHAPTSHSASMPSAQPSTPGHPVTSPSGGGMGGGSGSGGGSSSSATISTTGQNSENNITTSYTNNSKVMTTSTVAVSSSNCQNATSGNATSNGNTVGGGAGTSTAANGSGVDGSVVITN